MIFLFKYLNVILFKYFSSKNFFNQKFLTKLIYLIVLYYYILKFSFILYTSLTKSFFSLDNFQGKRKMLNLEIEKAFQALLLPTLSTAWGNERKRSKEWSRYNDSRWRRNYARLFSPVKSRLVRRTSPNRFDYVLCSENTGMAQRRIMVSSFGKLPAFASTIIL